MQYCNALFFKVTFPNTVCVKRCEAAPLESPHCLRNPQTSETSTAAHGPYLQRQTQLTLVHSIQMFRKIFDNINKNNK